MEGTHRDMMIGFNMKSVPTMRTEPSSDAYGTIHNRREAPYDTSPDGRYGVINMITYAMVIWLTDADGAPLARDASFPRAQFHTSNKSGIAACALVAHARDPDHIYRPDYRRLVTIALNGDVIFTDIYGEHCTRTMSLRSTCLNLALPVTGCIYNACKHLMAITDSGTRIMLFPPDRPQDCTVLGRHAQPVTGCAFSGDGGMIVSTSSREVRVWDTQARACIFLDHCTSDIICSYIPTTHAFISVSVIPGTLVRNIRPIEAVASMPSRETRSFQMPADCSLAPGVLAKSTSTDRRYFFEWFAYRLRDVMATMILAARRQRMRHLPSELWVLIETEWLLQSVA